MCKNIQQDSTTAMGISNGLDIFLFIPLQSLWNYGHGLHF
jgi:hypothetical protein